MTHPVAPVPHARGSDRDSIVFLVAAPFLLVAMLLHAIFTFLAGAINVGTVVRLRTGRSPRGPRTDTGTLFLPAITERGPVGEPVELNSLDDYKRVFGDRSSAATAYDALEFGWIAGLGTVFLARVVGPAAATATLTLTAGVDPVLRIDGHGPGAFSNDLRVAVEAGSSAGLFTLVVTRGGDELERHIDLASPAAAVEQLADDSDYIRGAVLGEANPDVAAAAPLVGGADDLAGITNDQWAAAYDTFSVDLGPGQVSTGGRTTTVAHDQVKSRTDGNFRTALLDTPDGANAVTLAGLAGAIDDDEDSRSAGLFAPWLDFPGTVAGTVRAIFPSVAVAARIAASDRVNHANASPAGDQDRGAGRLPEGTRLRTTYTDAEHQDLYAAGVNLFRADRDGVVLSTFRSASADKFWRQLNNWREVASLWYRLNALGRRFEQRTINGPTLDALNLALTDELEGDLRAGALHETASNPAYTVDVGDTVNTDETAANGEIHAAVAVSPSTVGVLVVFDVTVAQPGRGVAA